MATGVLPVFVGQATRAVEFAENSRKEYVAGLRLGLVTNTQDTTGELWRPIPSPSPATTWRRPSLRFRGRSSRSPPCIPP